MSTSTIEKPGQSLSLDAVRALQHNFIGPTWQRDGEEWILPARTLGWQIVRWCSDYMLNEQGGPWRFTLEQLRFVLWWYAVDDEGRFIYRKGVLQRMKGWGKDPLLAVLCLVELCGPVLFSRFDASGRPVGIPQPRALVQVTAVNQAQTSNTMDYIPGLISERMRQDFSIVAGTEIIRANRGRQKLQAVTSNYRAIEGKRTTFTLMNETHHWVLGNHGQKMYETIDGNATKMGARYLAITNAYLPGEDSVAERMRESFEKILEGRAIDVGFLYDSIEAHENTPLTPEALEIVLPIIRGDAIWLNPVDIIQSIQDTSIPLARSRRMWLNQVVAEGDSLYGPEQWKAIERPGALLRAGDEIVVGFDGGKTDDATALVAIRVKDRVAFCLHVQEKPEGPEGIGWEVNKDAVDSAVHETFRLYKVAGFFADVALWESYIDDWAELYRERVTVKASDRHALAWDMRASQKRNTMAHERLMASVWNAKIFWTTDDPVIRRHALNAKRHENNFGVSFRKESRESPRKVDVYAALMLAHEALHDLRTRTKQLPDHSGEAWFF